MSADGHGSGVRPGEQNNGEQDNTEASKRSGRGRLDHDEIVTAAIALIDLDGLGSLTMRRLGDALGVEAMALYRYFPSRQDLVGALVDSVVMQTATDPELQLVAGDDWTDYLHRLAHGTRRMALAHPRLFPLIATHPTEAPWIKPPLRSLRWVQSFLDGLQEHHFPPAASVTIYKRFSTFLLGHLLLEVAGLGLDHDPSLSAPPPAPDPIKQQAEQQRVEDAHEAADILTEGSTAEEILDAGTGRIEQIADEPTLQAADAALNTVHNQTEATAVIIDADAPLTQAMVSTQAMSVDDYPTVQALAGLLAHDTSVTDFEDMLTHLLTQFATLRRP